MLMRIIILFIILTLFACKIQIKPRGEEQAPKEVFSAGEGDKKIRQIHGEWLVVEVNTSSSDRETELLVENELAAYKEDMELNPMEFRVDSVMITGPTSHTTKLGITHWHFVPSNIIVMGFTGNESFYEVVQLKKDTMVLFSEMPVDNKKGAVRVMNKLLRIDSEKYGGRNIFNDSINWWRVQPSGPENEKAIAARLKAMLEYNYVYIRSLYYSGASFINTKKFNMPFLYYNGGIGLKNEFDAHDTFVDYFYTKEAALIALNKLREAFTKVEYKKKANYILEYAEFMKLLAGAIQ